MPASVNITKSFVESTNTPGTYRDTKLPGFCLRVRHSGKKFYAVSRKVRGSQANVTVSIGMHGVVSTEKARNDAKQIIAMMSAGINPNDKKREAVAAREADERKVRAEKLRKTITLQQALDEYLKARDLKDNTRYIYRISIERYLPDWLDMPLVEITKEQVEQRHQKLSDPHKAQANHTMRVLRAIFSYAIVAYETPDGKPLISDNPVKRLSQLRAWHRIPRRQTVVKAHQLKKWYSAVVGLPSDSPRDYLLLLLLTGLRKTEAATLTWKNIDLKGKTLTILDTKNREDHMLPLSDFLYQLLLRRWQDRGNEYVFTGPSGKGRLIDCRDSIAKVIEESGSPFTLHDLRRTFITTAEQLDIPYYALKRLLNHKLGADVTSGYIVTDVERLREPMQKITDELLSRCGVKSTRGKRDASKAASAKRASK